MRLSEEEFANLAAKKKKGTAPLPVHKPRHKFRAVPVAYDGIKFSSTLEANYYVELKKRVALGEVLFFLRQVPFHLPGNVKYIVDFQEFHTDGSCHFVDTKGVETPEFIMKKKQVEALYPVTIEIVKKSRGGRK